MHHVEHVDVLHIHMVVIVMITTAVGHHLEDVLIETVDGFIEEQIKDNKIKIIKMITNNCNHFFCMLK